MQTRSGIRFPSFHPRRPWWGPDLQTLRNLLVEPRAEIPAERSQRLLLPLADGSGDALAAVLDEPAGVRRGRRPLVVLIHGLSGHEESAYMRISARYWLDRGLSVVRLNLRGAGPSRQHCRLQYHAGRTADLHDALAVLRSQPELCRSGFVLVGFSLGGNMLLKFLAEYGDQFQVVAAGSVSAPIDLAQASVRFRAPRNAFYQRYLLGHMKRECFGGAAELSPSERVHVWNARSVYEFDDRFVAPRNGFRDADHYYAECNAQRFLAGIRVPTLVIHAADDPWIPDDAYRRYAWSGNPHLELLLAPGGGHVGFHDRAHRTPWHDRCLGRFVDARLGVAASED